MYFGNNLQGTPGAQFWEAGNVYPPFTSDDIINTNRNIGGGAFGYLNGLTQQALYILKNIVIGLGFEINPNKGARIVLDGNYVNITVDDLSLPKSCDRNQSIDFIEDTVDDGAGNQMRERMERDAKFFIYNGSDLFVIGKTGKLGTNQTQPFVTPLANTVARMPIYDQTGAFVGYIPII